MTDGYNFRAAAPLAGVVSPGTLGPVWAICCARCARVELLPWTSATKSRKPDGREHHSADLTKRGVSKSAAYARSLGWLYVDADLEGSGVYRVWVCPDCPSLKRAERSQARNPDGIGPWR